MRLMLVTKHRRVLIFTGTEAEELMTDDDSPEVVQMTEGSFGFAPTLAEPDYEEDE